MTFEPGTSRQPPGLRGDLGQGAENGFDPFIFVDANFATMLESDPDDSGFGYVKNGAIVISQGKILWLGGKDKIPEAFRRLPSCSAGGRLVTPGLVECHSHLIFAGDRRKDFALRTAGMDYAELVWSGRGILSTVEATRKASEDELYQSALRRLIWFKQNGVTTIEVKSGYGLDVETELKLLRVAERLSRAGVAKLKRTLLAGHIYPSGVDQEAFVESVCLDLIPQAVEQGLCDAVEVYCEESLGLSLEDASTIL
jgi:imidazolonepropionase